MSYVRTMGQVFTIQQGYAWLLGLAALVLALYAQPVRAEDTAIPTDAPAATSTSGVGLQKHAESINKAIPAMTTLVASIGFLGGIAFAVIGIIKFKHHKENPQQTPLGVPITLILVAAGLIFLPTMISSTGETLTGATIEDTGKGSATGRY